MSDLICKCPKGLYLTEDGWADILEERVRLGRPLKVTDVKHLFPEQYDVA